MKPSVPCRGCGVAVRQPRRGRSRISCSFACKDARPGSRNPSSASRPCHQCGSAVPREKRPDSLRAFCNAPCRILTQHYESAVRSYANRLPHRDCYQCGVPFRPLRLSHRYCSQPCQTKATKTVSNIQRAYVAGPRSSVDRLAIYQRDAWVCQLCFALVDPLATGGAKPSLDHVIPLVAGGLHNATNLQLAHLRCNLSKGRRVPVAVRLSLELVA